MTLPHLLQRFARWADQRPAALWLYLSTAMIVGAVALTIATGGPQPVQCVVVG